MQIRDWICLRIVDFKMFLQSWKIISRCCFFGIRC